MSYDEVLKVVRDLSEGRLATEPGRKVVKGPLQAGPKLLEAIRKYSRRKSTVQTIGGGEAAGAEGEGTATAEQPGTSCPRPWMPKRQSSVSATWDMPTGRGLGDEGRGNSNEGGRDGVD